MNLPSGSVLADGVSRAVAGVCLAGVVAGGLARADGGEWPQWRGGVERTGAQADGPALADRWPVDGPPRLWRTDLPSSTSPGSVSVAGGRVYVSLAHAVTDAAGTHFTSAVYCLDATEGGVVWRRELGRTVNGWVMPGGTPAVVDGRAYVVHGPEAEAGEARPARKAQRTTTVEIRCLDALTGETVWTNAQEVTTASVMMHGSPFSSPLVVDGVCVAQFTGAVAYDAATGRRLWTQPLVDGAHASPAAWLGPEGTRVLCCSAKSPPESPGVVPVQSPGTDPNVAARGGGILCLDLKSGAVLWSLPSGGSMWHASTPVVAGHLLLALGSHQATRAVDIAVSPPCERWTSPSDPSVGHYGPTMTVMGDFVYTPVPAGLACQEVSSGKVTATLMLPVEGRMAGLFASAAGADGKLVYGCVGRGGKEGFVYLVQGGPEAKALSRFAVAGLLEHASPVVADGRLYLRLTDGVACYDLRRAAPAAP